MTGKIYFIFGSSFVMGMFSGVFLYLTVFAPEYGSIVDGSEFTAIDAHVIEGTMYGGCSETDTCASFKLIDNRKYQYLPYPEADVEKGTLPGALEETLTKMLDVNTLSDASNQIQNTHCESFVDGVDYTYDITLDGYTYTLDTCDTSFVYNSKLQSALLDTWAFMAHPTTTYPKIIEEGVGAYIFDRFNSSREKE